MSLNNGMTPERLAALFHETYERLAPEHQYETREASAVPWNEVPDNNKQLMIAVAGQVLQKLQPGVQPLRRFLLQRYEFQSSTFLSNTVETVRPAEVVVAGELNVFPYDGMHTVNPQTVQASIKMSKTVAHGIEFSPAGPAALFWPDSLSISTYPTLDALKKVHCSSNSFHDQRVEWIDS